MENNDKNKIDSSNKSFELKDKNANKTLEIDDDDDANKLDDTKKDEKSSLSKEEKRKRIIDIINAVTLRLLFIAEAIVYLLFTTCIINNTAFLVLIINILVIIADGLYIVIKRHGVELKWFSISIASFTIIFIISNWVLVFHKLNLKDPGCLNASLTSLNSGNFCFTVHLHTY